MGPLAGIKVVEFAGLGPAPFAAMLLADMDATVIRIARKTPEAPSPAQGTFLERGRTTFALDLTLAEDRERVFSELCTADVLIEGFRPGIMEKLGLGPDVVLRENPRLIYGRMTGYGRAGPLAEKAGHDINFLAISGILSLLGQADSPPLPPYNLIADFGGGGMYLAFGVVAALFEAARSGKGQVVEAAMIAGATHLSTYIHAQHARGRLSPERGNNLLDGGAPFYRTYETRDGRYIAVGAIEPRFYSDVLKVLDLEIFAGCQNDRKRWAEMHAAFADAFRSRSRDEWDVAFAGVDACISPVLSLDEALDHPQMHGAFKRRGDVIEPAPSPSFSRTVPLGAQTAARAPGEGLV